ncbi:MAG: amidase [Thermaerobacterales bacterium]
MGGEPLIERSATELAALIKARQLSAVELTQAYLDRIDRFNGYLSAYITVCRDEALAAAAEADARLARGEETGPLHGLPFGVKDQFDTQGVRTTVGSRVYADRVPGRDSTVVARIKAAGGILIGKHNMTEFACGMGDPYVYGDPPRNAWDHDRDPFSSSTGSGIAVAASMCALAVGEDTGGSIRAPASANGIVGLRPTWGRVSRHGMFPLSWSMDAAGPMTRSVADAALLLGVIAGSDAADPQTSKRPVPDYGAGFRADLSGRRIGVIAELTDGDAVHEEVRTAVLRAVQRLVELGASVDTVSVPLLNEIGPATVVWGSDAFYVHRDGLRDHYFDYGPTVRRRVIAAGLLPVHLHQKAMRIRALFRDQWVRAFDGFDVLISPTLSKPVGPISYAEPIRTAAAAAARMAGTGGGTTIPAAFAGTPAMTLPCGFDSHNLPVGLQIMGRRFQEDQILSVGWAYENSTDWHRRRPQLTGGAGPAVADRR